MQFLCQLDPDRLACATHNCALSQSAKGSETHKKCNAKVVAPRAPDFRLLEEIPSRASLGPALDSCT